MEIARAFVERFGGEPRVIVRAPGRVNLVGEHTDYSLLPVLPMAIGQGLTIAAAPADDGEVIALSEGAAGEAKLPRRGHGGGRDQGWGRYLRGVLQEMGEFAPGQGARLYVAGDLPAEGGLSSSSALAVGAMAALAACWGADLDGEELARRAAAAERHVGTETGGMDQLAIVFGEEGHALRLDFAPPARRAVPLPAGLAFVVASSGEAAPKGGAARDAYNERVVGARIATAMLADAIGLDPEYPLALRQVADVDVTEILADGLPEKISAQEAAHGVALDVEHLVRLSAGRFDQVAKVPVRRVAHHVLAEAARVDAAEAALLAGELGAFGRLLDESHASLREFGCSTGALDRLCAAMRRAGALGARLTGAGFGGFALAAVAAGGEQAVIDAALAAAGGPAFAVRASRGLHRL